MLSKENTLQVKGIAILCMMLYHLFGFPERIPKDFVLSWMGSPLTKSFQICVPVYVFMAGYGLSCVANKQDITWGFIGKRLYKLYFAYWWIALPFITMGILIGYYTFDWYNLLLAITGIRMSVINGEWWFYSLYVELLLLFFFISRIQTSRIRYVILMIGVLFLSRILINVLPLNERVIIFRHIKMLLININIFMMGCFFAKYNFYYSIVRRFSFLSKIYFVPLLLALPLIGRAYIPFIGITELLFVPMFVFGCVNICKGKNGEVCMFLGHHSMNLWLIHSFFIFYYLNGVTFLFHNPAIMLAIVVLASLTCSICIEWLKKRICFLKKNH